MSWIPIETTLPQKREVLLLADELDCNTDEVVGILVRLWAWGDTEVMPDGNAPSVTPALLDRAMGVTGLALALEKVGWLFIEDGGLQFANWEAHNSKSAKARKLTAKRVASHRSKCNASSVTQALPHNITEHNNTYKREGASKKRKSGSDVSFDWPESMQRDGFPKAWEDWLAYRRQRGLGTYAERTVKSLTKKLTKAGPRVAAATIELSIENGWQGLFPDKITGDKHGKTEPGLGHEPDDWQLPNTNI